MSRKYSLLILHNRYQQAGGEDVVVEAEAKLLRDHGHQVRVEAVDRVAGEVSLPGPHTTRRTGPYRAVPEGHE